MMIQIVSMPANSEASRFRVRAATTAPTPTAATSGPVTPLMPWPPASRLIVSADSTAGSDVAQRPHDLGRQGPIGEEQDQTRLVTTYVTIAMTTMAANAGPALTTRTVLPRRRSATRARPIGEEAGGDAGHGTEQDAAVVGDVRDRRSTRRHR